MPRRVKLTLEYDGTDFHGWQVQNRGAPGSAPAGSVRTVQGEVERVLALLAGTPVRITGAGRTDEGAHALGQVASFDWPSAAEVPVAQLAAALNANLPADLSAVSAEEMPADFHAQVSAQGKHYRYRIFNRHARPALALRTHWHVRFPLQLEPMRKAAGLLLGRHDFAAFATTLAEIQEKRSAEGKTALSTVREIRRLEVLEPGPEAGGLHTEGATAAGRELAIEVEGSGFLYKMVRTIAGSLVEVGRGKHPPEWIGTVLAAQDRRLAGPTAPAKGICLVRVFY